MIRVVHVVVLYAVVGLAAGTAPTCIDGWSTYKDELCIKVFSTLDTYAGAREFCSSQETGASLVIVKEQELQQLLANYTDGTVDNIWLGGKYDQQLAQFVWEDGSALTFTNWQDGYPRSVPDNCIELRPSDGKKMYTGKWADVSCQRRNLVMCQKSLTWSLQDAVNEIINLRKQLENANSEIVVLKEASVETNAKMEEVSSRVIPVGSTYVEYSEQPSPITLWPTLAWEDVTSKYAGLFFRAYGGGSAEEWGVTQSECSPRITKMNCIHERGAEYSDTIDIPATGWSAFGFAGSMFESPNARWNEALRFYTEGCEVRPRNQAIRIWKRTA